MKKIFTLLVLSSFLVSGLKAQYYYIPFINAGQNPGGLNNDSELPVAGLTGWTTIQIQSATPVWSANQTIPFAFSFNGVPVTQFKVSTSGVLTFDIATVVAAPSYTKAALPSASIPDNAVCIWGLGAIGANDYIISKTFGTAPNRQFWIQFNSYGYGTVASGNTDYTYWSIVLEESTNSIYLVDARTGGFATTKNVSAGIQINSTTAVSVAGSPNLASVAGTSSGATDNSYYQFSLGAQPDFDLFVNDITTSAYLSVGNNTIKGVIKNIGLATITSLTLNYKINGGTAVTDAVTGISIAPFGSYTFTHSIPWNTTASGAYTVECYATDLNGSNLDQYPANDSKIKTINILTALVVRIPLFEIFTSSTCPPCTPGNTNFHNIIDPLNQAQHVYIKYQQDFPGTGDPYATAESVSRRGFYAISSIPRMENDGGWDGNAQLFTSTLYQDAKAVPAQYEMTGTYTADTITRTFSAKVLYSPLFNATGTKLYTAIVEKETSLNIKTNGETAFYNVMKKMLPDQNGTTISNIAPGVWDSVSVTYTFNGNYRLPANGQVGNVINNAVEHSVEEFSDLVMMGWLQSSTGNKQVFQAANFVLSSVTGVYEMNKSINSILIYPNPAHEFTEVCIELNAAENLKIQLMDVEGKTLEVREIAGKSGLLKEKFNISNFANGIYHVAVSDSKNNSFVKRIIVAH